MRLWPFGKKKDEGSKGGLLSFLLLKGERLPDAALVLKYANELDPISPMSLSGEPGPEPVLQFEFGGANLLAAHMPAPVPGTEIEDNLPFSPFWTKGSDSTHRSHVVLIAGHQDYLGLAMAGASRIGAALLKADGGIGWYVGNASMVHSPEFAWDCVKAAEDDWTGTLPLWVNIPITQDEAGAFSASTIGMEGMGHREFEIVWSSMPPADLREWLLDLCAYVLERGPIMKPGQTFGRTADEKWKIEVGASKLGKPGSVIRLGLG